MAATTAARTTAAATAQAARRDDRYDDDDGGGDADVAAMVEPVMTAASGPQQPGPDAAAGAGGDAGPPPCGPDEFEQSYMHASGASRLGSSGPTTSCMDGGWRAARCRSRARAGTHRGRRESPLRVLLAPRRRCGRFDMAIGAAPAWFAAMDG